MNTIKILIGNFNCEDLWRGGSEAKIPKMDLYGVNGIINHLDELFIFYAQKDDILILRKHPDQIWLDYLEALHITIPQIYVINNEDSTKSLGELILEDPDLLDKLKTHADSYKKLGYEVEVVPYGVTLFEERIAQSINVRINSQASLSAWFNNKSEARKLVIQCGVEVPIGQVCNNVSEFRAISKDFLEKYGAIIIKELLGSGGSSIYIIRTRNQLKSFTNLYETSGNEHKSILIERLYHNLDSYNYQFYLSNGVVIPHVFSKQILNNGKIIGSLFNRKLSLKDEIVREHFNQALSVAKYIAGKGYNGILGFDSLVTDSRKLYPIIDINCRINLSTLFDEIHGKYFKTQYALFYYFELKNVKALIYEDMLLYLMNKNNIINQEGILVLNYNENRFEDKIRYARIFVGLFYNDYFKLTITFNNLKKTFKKAQGEYGWGR